MRRIRLWCCLISFVFCGTARAQVGQLFTWDQGQGLQVMMPSSTHLCVLTLVKGGYAGGGEYVRMRHTATKDGSWSLEGASQQAGVGAAARCFPLSLFTSGVPTANLLKTSSPEDARVWGNPDFCQSNPGEGWPGEAMTHITYFGGKFRGGGEYIEVHQSLSAFSPNTWLQHSCQDATMHAGTHSFFVGKKGSDHFATFFGPNSSVSGPANVVGEYSVGSNQSLAMSPVDKAVCYFTRISGGFHGGGEFASIDVSPGTGGQTKRWVLRTSSKSGDGVWAKARCYAFAQ